MAPGTSTRRLSLDLFQKPISEFLPEAGLGNEVSEVKCECCGLSEDCTRAYVRRIRDWFCGRWVCGLCSEAIKGELEKLGHVGREEALRAHMEVCNKYNKMVRVNPAMSLAGAMAEILKKSSRQRSDGRNKKGCKVRRSFGVLPSHVA